jgi:hypothetical protein
VLSFGEELFPNDVPMKAFWVLAMMVFGYAVFGQRERSEPVNPTTFVSASGKVTCFVDPTKADGSGAADYVVLRNGEKGWEGRKPFTLYNAVVADDGRVAGYAYSHGLDGWARNGETNLIHLILLDAAGKLLLDETRGRQTVILHGVPEPYGEGVALDEKADRFLIEIQDRSDRESRAKWLGFRLSTGKALREGSPKGLEIKTNPHQPEKLQPSFRMEDVPEGKLEVLGEFSLQADRKEAVRSVLEFRIDGEGQIGFIRQESQKAYAFVLVKPDGELVTEMSLDMLNKIPDNDSPHLAWVGDGTWVITSSPFEKKSKSSGWWLEVEGRKISEIKRFDSVTIEKVIGDGQGGFVTLGEYRMEYSSDHDLARYERDGSLLWRKRQHGMSGKKDDLLSPEDVAITSNGEVTVLDKIRHTLQIFSMEGKYLRTVDLDREWGRKANYPADLSADLVGGFLVKDFRGKPEFVRMDAQGKVRAEFNARHPDGRSMDAVRGVQVASNGRVWVSDGPSLARLSDDGVVDLVLGSAPQGQTLGEIAEVETDEMGNLYAVDRRTGSVHQFDSNGKRVRVYEAKPADFTAQVSGATIAIEPKGGVFLGVHDKSNFLHFSKDGTRLKDVRLSDWSMPKLAALANGNFLVTEYVEALLLSGDRKLIQRIERRPDRRWFKNTDAGYAREDGSFAIVSHPGYWRGEPWPVSFYGADGKPQKMMVMPGECNLLAVSGRIMATIAGDRIVALDEGGKPIFKAQARPQAELKNSEIFATRNGKEIWLVEGRSKVFRFGVASAN